MKTKFMLSLTLGITSISQASQQTSTVDYIQSHNSNGFTYLNLVGSKENITCGGADIWIIKNPDTNIGNQQFSMILAAASAGKTITIVGSGSCPTNLQLNGEYVESIKYRN